MKQSLAQYLIEVPGVYGYRSTILLYIIAIRGSALSSSYMTPSFTPVAFLDATEWPDKGYLETGSSVA